MSRPFRHLGLEIEASSTGAGLQLATPVARKFNLRGGAAFLNVSPSGTANGIDFEGALRLRNANLALDWFPFGNGFRISPWLGVYADNKASAAVNVPANGAFSLGDTDYTSSPTDPVHGTAAGVLGSRRVAPGVTAGWGNLIPRNGRHWSVPVEFGFQYVGTPSISLDLEGTACQTATYEGRQVAACAPLATNPDAQSDLQAEIQKLNEDVRFLRFYPIVNVGVSYRF